MSRLRVVNVPSIKTPIMPSPGFAKKELSTFKLDLMAKCGMSCAYCSSNAGRYMTVNKAKFSALAMEQAGTPDTAESWLNLAWPDVIEKLDAQLRARGPKFGAGHTLVFSMLTDAFSGEAFKSGATKTALEMVLERSAFRVRVLTKNSVVGLSGEWRDFWQKWRKRVVVGLSIGTLDDEWAARVEVGCPPPSARIQALHSIPWDVPTFGMLCPIFPDVLNGDGGRLEALVASVRPSICEHVWAEPYNDRQNWQAVRAGYGEGTGGWEWMTDIYQRRNTGAWSRYATTLYLRLRELAERDGWLHKLRYLLYEDQITDADAVRFGDMTGVLLQSPADEMGRSKHPVFWAKQQRTPEAPR